MTPSGRQSKRAPDGASLPGAEHSREHAPCKCAKIGKIRNDVTSEKFLRCRQGQLLLKSLKRPSRSQADREPICNSL